MNFITFLQNYTVEIFYLPLVVTPYSDDLFFMPVFASLYPLLSPDVPRISRHHQAVTRGDKIKPLNTLSKDRKVEINLFLRIMM